jgi:tetratricopeptide (TPR) repeat protein
MACGCPVITCRNSAIPEVAGDAALYVAEDNVAELVQALTAIQLAETREPLIAKGFERAKLFSWAKMAKTVKSVLLEVAEKNVAKTSISPDFSYALEWKKRKNLSLIIKQPPIIQMVQTGRTQEAINLLNQQINTEPTQAFAYNDLGVLLFPTTDKQQQAVKYVEQALSLNPIDVGILKNLAKVYSFIGKDEEAFNILASLFDNQPDNAEIVLEMAEICTFLKREALAKQFWDKVKQLPKSTPSPQKSPPAQGQQEITLSVMQQATLQTVQAGQTNEVIAKLTEALEIEPNNALNHNDLGVLLFSNEQTRLQAIEHLKAAITYQPNQVTIIRNLAKVYTFFKRHDEVKPLWEHLLRLKPNDTEAEEALAQFITIALPASSSPKKKSKAKKRKKKRG